MKTLKRKPTSKSKPKAKPPVKAVEQPKPANEFAIMLRDMAKAAEAEGRRDRPDVVAARELLLAHGM